MKSKPVRKYAQPNYPTRLEIAVRPALLHRHQPPAWRKWPELTGAAGLFLLADTARLPAADSPSNGGQTPPQIKALTLVAPIFEHGEGRGATGCVVMSPPAFLSEEEALQVIREELATSGVKAWQTNFVVPGVKITPALWEIYQEDGKMQFVPPSEKPLVASAADSKRKVAVEFVSERNCHRLGAPASSSTVQSYNLKAVAKSVAAEVQKQGQEKLYFGTFYDPLAGTWRSGKAESQRLLRLQVQDFIQWLQAQGAI
jgi:hypothetical protein